MGCAYLSKDAVKIAESQKESLPRDARIELGDILATLIQFSARLPELRQYGLFAAALRTLMKAIGSVSETKFDWTVDVDGKDFRLGTICCRSKKFGFTVRVITAETYGASAGVVMEFVRSNDPLHRKHPSILLAMQRIERALKVYKRA